MSRISVEKAFKRVQDVEKISSRQLKFMNLRSSVECGGRERLFILHNDNDVLITPADDELAPVLGKCEKAGSEVPPALKDWLSVYAEEIRWYQEGGKYTEPEPLSDTEPDGGQGDEGEQLTNAVNGVAPLTESTWGQKWPFNKYCKFEGKYSKVGCPGIAVGQLMYYWAKKGYRRGCIATEAYTSAEKQYAVEAMPAVSKFDYKNIINGTPLENDQIDAVAKMLAQIGRALKMDYTPNGSGAPLSVIKKQIVEAFRLCSTVKEMSQKKKGETKFRNAIISDLKLNRPVLVYGANEANTGAHIFICDGYDETTDKFHMNWGWFGDFDGWYDLTALGAKFSNGKKAFDFSYNRWIYYNIQPTYYLGDVNSDNRINMVDVSSAISDRGRTDAPQSDVDYDGTVTMKDVQLITDHILGKDTL